MRFFLTTAAFWAILMVIAGPFVAWYGPGIESRFFPVLSDQSATSTRDGDKVTFTIDVTKNRNCRMAEGSFHIVRKKGPFSERAAVIVKTLSGAPLGSASYPTGQIRLGPFEADIPPYFADADYIEALLYYDCHWGWLTPQVLGPVPIPRLEASP